MKDGIHYGLDINEYHDNDTHESSTDCKPAIESSLDYLYKQELRRLEREQRKAGVLPHVPHFDFGNAFELKLIGDPAFEKTVAIFDDTEIYDKLIGEGKARPRSTKEYKEWKDAWDQEHSEAQYHIAATGETESLYALEHMVRNAKKNKIISDAITNMDYQPSCFWTDPETGLKLKTRPDVVRVTKETLIDIKTCADASPHGFGRQLHNLDYPFQAVMQIEGAIQTGLIEKLGGYYWLAVQKTPPYHACLYEFVPRDIKLVKAHIYDFVLSRIKKAKETGNYPGYEEQADNPYGVLSMGIKNFYYEKACMRPLEYD